MFKLQSKCYHSIWLLNVVSFFHKWIPSFAIHNFNKYFEVSQKQFDFIKVKALFTNQQKQSNNFSDFYFDFRPAKRDPINLCPICDFKEPSREHISRHFMNELLDHVATLPDNYACR